MWNILGRKSVICAILAGVPRNAGKIKSTGDYFSSHHNVYGNLLHAFIDPKSDAVDSSVCDKVRANQGSEKTPT